LKMECRMELACARRLGKWRKNEAVELRQRVG